MLYGPQDEPICETAEERAALPEPEHAVHFGPQGEVVVGTDRSVCALCGQKLPDDEEETEDPEDPEER